MNDIFLYLIFTIKLVLGENCNRSFPIFKENECQLIYCTGEQYKNEICKINNEIIKNQWLTNIIYIGKENSRFFNFANFSNGTMVVEVSSDSDNDESERIFFGLKPDGDYLFNNNQDGNHEYIMIGSGKREYAENFCATIEENGEYKEYIISIPNEGLNAELYDFESDSFYQTSSTNLIQKKIIGKRHSSTNLLISGYYLIVFQSWVQFDEETTSFRTNVLEFGTKNLVELINLDLISKVDYELREEIGEMTSCFVSKSNYIWTMGLINEGSNLSYWIIIYSPFNLERKVDWENFKAFPFYKRVFFKIVHLKDDIGVAFYYSYPYYFENNKDLAFPSFIVRKIVGKNIINYMSPYHNDPIVIDFHNKLFNFDCLLNDVIRLSDCKISFSTMDYNKAILYIIIIEIYSPKDYFLKLFEVDLYALYNIKFFEDIREHIFEKQIVLGFNYCNTASCSEGTHDTHYSAFLIFGYPNSTDGYLNVNQYFEENNGATFDNINIDLIKYVNVENNIFGYTFASIYIVKLIGCDDILLKSTNENGNTIDVNYELSEEEKIKIKFKNKMKAFDCTIHFRYVLIDPSYLDGINYYIDEISSTDFNDYEEIYNSKRNKYFGKISTYNIMFDYVEPTYPINTIQFTMLNMMETEKLTNDNKENIITEINDVDKKTEMNEGIELTETNKYVDKSENNIYPTIKVINQEIKNTIKINEKMTESAFIAIQNIQTQFKDKIETQKNEKTYIREDNICSNEEVLDNKCGDGIVEVDQIKDLFNQFSSNIFSFNYLGGDMKTIQTQNVIFQIILLNAQDLGLNPNVSFVNIGECEKILKNVYDIPDNYSLIMVKSDSKTKDNSATNVLFELYHPITKTKLNMSFCNDVEIKIDIPIQLENNTLDLYDSLLESGYNLFDSNDSFYNDICTVYTSINGTDMILSDRQNIIYSQSGNISLCQVGCSFRAYNKTIKTVQCDCNVQSTSVETNHDEIDKNELKQSFINTLLNSNFMVLKCIKEAFNFKNIFTNKGRIAMTIIIFFFNVIIIIYFINDKNTINKYFKLILTDKMKVQGNNSSKNNDKDKGESFISEKQNNDNNNNYQITENHNVNNNIEIINIEKKKKEQKQNHEIKNQFPPKKTQIVNTIIKINSNNIKAKRKPQFNFFNSIIKGSKVELSKINLISKMKMKERIEILEKSERLKLSEKKDKNNNIKSIKETDEIENYKNMNDDELNSLEYEKALIYDKRTFFQYYWSLLKKEQLILFTFFPTNDYNLVSLKMTLFVISLSLEITINGFFFTDDTMHQIHEDNGDFDLIYQIPQILYSSVISTVLNSLLQKLALSEDSFLSLKQINNYEKAIRQSESIKKCLTIKFIVFIVISFILILFCWYYISCFCAIYLNTQSILFKDTLISLLLSNIYPFGLCLLPGICRISALQAEKKDKKCLYKFSGFVELI